MSAKSFSRNESTPRRLRHGPHPGDCRVVCLPVTADNPGGPLKCPSVIWGGNPRTGRSGHDPGGRGRGFGVSVPTLVPDYDFFNRSLNLVKPHVSVLLDRSQPEWLDSSYPSSSPRLLCPSHRTPVHERTVLLSHIRSCSQSSTRTGGAGAGPCPMSRGVLDWVRSGVRGSGDGTSVPRGVSGSSWDREGQVRKTTLQRRESSTPQTKEE